MPLDVQAGRLLWPVLDERKISAYEADVKSGRIGGGLLRWGMPRRKAKRFIKQLKTWAAQAPGGLPFWIAVDHEGGSMFTQSELGTVFPGNMALGATGSAGLAQKAAWVSAGELRQLGVDINFAPVVDVNSNPKNPIVGVRSFGEDPLSVASLGGAAVRGYLRGGILPAIKHFPGHGNTSVDSHSSLPSVVYGRERWDRVDLPPFRAALRAGAPLVMTAHLTAPALGAVDVPVTFSSAVIKTLLRGELAFDGVVVSDSLDMGAISKNRYSAEQAAVAAVKAGCNALLVGKGDPARVREALVHAAQADPAFAESIRDSVRRLEGLSSQVESWGSDPDASIGGAQDVARRIAEASVTIVRSTDELRPLRLARKDSILVATFAHRRFDPSYKLLVREVQRRHGNTRHIQIKNKISVSSAAVLAAQADVVVFVTHQWGKRVSSLQQEAFFEILKASKPVVHISALNPYESAYYDKAEVQFLTYGTSPASMRAAVRLLFGEIAPKGGLPITLSD